MKRTLVTGAAGFIGSHVVRDLLENTDARIKAMVRPGEDAASLDGLDVEIVEADITDPAAVDAALEGVDTLFHLAAVYSVWMPDWKPLWEINMAGSRNILWAALRRKVKKTVYTSSMSAIGVAPGKQAASETTPFCHYGANHHYVLSKYLSQQEALGFAQNGLDLVVVNPAFPFGVRDRGPTPTGELILKIVKGINRLDFSGGINVVDVRDVARGHVLAAQKGKCGEKYILGNRNVTMAQFHRMVCEAAGMKPKRLIPMPVFPLKAMAWGLTAWSDKISKRPPLSTPQDLSYAADYLFCDNQKASRELGMAFSPVEKSLEESVEWFRANGFL